jgi:DNA-binding LytR/AlgR family response regulator
MVFLDIDMPQMSGLDVAAKLNHLSDHVILIFMSSHDEFMIETFQFTPFRYIQKSHVAEQITAVLQAALIKADSNQNQSIVLRTSELGEMQLSLSEITYIEREHRMLAIHCINGDIIHTWSNLKDIMNTFHSDRLIQIHSGCAVNAQHVKGFVKGRNIILLKDTTQLHVSRMSIKNIQQQLSQYWRKQV